METKKDTVNLLTELQKLVTEVRDGNLTQISKLTKRLILADCWGIDDMQMLEIVSNMIDAVDLRLHLYEKWLREKLEEDVTEEEEQ